MKLKEVIKKSLSPFDSYYALLNLSSSKILVEKEGEEIIGFVELKIYEDVGIIFYLGVLPCHRGKGHGKALVKKAEDYFIKKGLSLSLASTRDWNKVAVSLFTSLNYKVFKDDEVSFSVIELLNAYDDNLVLCKELKKEYLVRVFSLHNLISKFWKSIEGP